MAKSPRNPAELSREVERLIHQGQFEQARQLGLRLISAQPTSTTAVALLATAEVCLERPTEARERLQIAIARDPKSPLLQRTLGSAYRAEGNPQQALQAMQQALDLAPDDRTTRSALAELHALVGDPDAGSKTLEPIIAQDQWDANTALAHAIVCEALGNESQALAPLQAAMRQPAIPLPARIQLLYRLGSLNDKLAQYDRAFAAYDAANRMQPVPYDPDAMDKAIDDTIQNWTPESIANLPKAEPTDRPVLIVGMPRSGTSLVEQILASHPEVFGGDERGLLTQIAAELDPPDVPRLPIVRSPARIRRQAAARASKRYLQMLDALANDQPRVTDKLPTNFLHLGLVASIAPGTRVIACKRDPMDTCLSCYFQNFSPSMMFSFNLEHLARFHRAHDRLMDHWNHVLEIPILEIAYENLVEATEHSARNMIDFLDLPWNNACLEFHKSKRVQMTSSHQQVRKPIYQSSVRRHENYTKHLVPLQSALAT